MGFKEFWSHKSRVSQVIFIVIIMYCVSSINVLLLALGIMPYIPGVYLNPYVLIAFAIISFLITLLISIYHLSTMIRRRKRKCDQLADADKVCKKALS
jgi:membrane protein implicated in regulation of membrane protease activity